MTHIFYILGLIPLLYELAKIRNPKRIFLFTKRFKSKKSKNFSFNDKIFSFTMLFYLIWNLTGLFTVQWSVFAILLILSAIPTYKVWILFVDALVSFFVIFFIIINKYHLHIDIDPILILHIK